MCSEAMRSPLISPANSISKPSIRKHSSSENLFADHHHYLHLPQQEKHTLALSPRPPSPSRKAHSSIYTCICFIFLFFIITIAAFICCSNIDPPQIMEHSFSVACCHSKEQVPSMHAKPSHAWKGLGTIFVRGTRPMTELVVAHIAENTRVEELRLFLRTSYRSGVVARADFVFLFAPNARSAPILNVIHDEDHNFHRLLRMVPRDDTVDGIAINSAPSTSTSTSPSRHVFSNSSVSTFNVNAYRRGNSENASSSQPFWGSHTTNHSQSNGLNDQMAFKWGSMVGFDTSELNADDTLQGFFDHPPIMLTRWPCYQMLLGIVRHRFKHVLLTDASGVALLRDPFTLATRRKVGLFLSLEDRAWGASNAAVLGVNVSTSIAAEFESVSAGSRRDRVTLSSTSRAALRKQTNAQLNVHQRGVGGKRRARKSAAVGGLYECVYGKRMWSTLEEFERRKKLVNSGVIMGGVHQIRGLANAMVTEIVRVAMERANRDAFPDSVLLSYLLHKSSSVLGKRVLEHLHLLENGESFVHSLIGSQQPSLFLKRTRSAYAMVQGNRKSKWWGNAALVIHSDICTSPADAMVYIDCAFYTNKLS